MFLTRVLERVTGSRRSTSTVHLFREAIRCRDEGRFEEATELVERGLDLDHDNLVGLLLSGSLHCVFREMDAARADFERVLAVESTHPRALLGLARIAFEAGDPAACGVLLERALARYPDFPEAQALLEVTATPGPAAHQRPPQPARPSINPDRLRLPAEAVETVVARSDASLIFAQPWGARAEEHASVSARLCRVASALLTRCGYGPLRQAAVEGTAELVLLRTDGEVVLSITMDRDADLNAAETRSERVWAGVRQELGGRGAA